MHLLPFTSISELSFPNVQFFESIEKMRAQRIVCVCVCMCARAARVLCVLCVCVCAVCAVCAVCGCVRVRARVCYISNINFHLSLNPWSVGPCLYPSPSHPLYITLLFFIYNICIVYLIIKGRKGFDLSPAHPVSVSVRPSVRPSIHPSIHPSTYLPTYPSNREKRGRANDESLATCEYGGPLQ